MRGIMANLLKKAGNVNPYLFNIKRLLVFGKIGRALFLTRFNRGIKVLHPV